MEVGKLSGMKSTQSLDLCPCCRQYGCTNGWLVQQGDQFGRRPQGLKIRIPGLGGEVFKRIGGLPVLLPGSELFTALQTGAIDASEWVAPYNDLAFGLHKAAKYYYYPGWHEPGPALELIVQKGF